MPPASVCFAPRVASPFRDVPSRRLKRHRWKGHAAEEESTRDPRQSYTKVHHHHYRRQPPRRRAGIKGVSSPSSKANDRESVGTLLLGRLLLLLFRFLGHLVAADRTAVVVRIRVIRRGRTAVRIGIGLEVFVDCGVLQKHTHARASSANAFEKERERGWAGTRRSRRTF